LNDREPPLSPEHRNGAAAAAFLAVGIGAAGLGLVVLLDAAGLFSVPALYGPAGGVSGRTTAGVLIWLIAWAALHHRWKRRDLALGRVSAAGLLLIGLGLLFMFPPFWGLF
jgi:hypothetical protein